MKYLAALLLSLSAVAWARPPRIADVCPQDVLGPKQAGERNLWALRCDYIDFEDFAWLSRARPVHYVTFLNKRAPVRRDDDCGDFEVLSVCVLP